MANPAILKMKFEWVCLISISSANQSIFLYELQIPNNEAWCTCRFRSKETAFIPQRKKITLKVSPSFLFEQLTTAGEKALIPSKWQMYKFTPIVTYWSCFEVNLFRSLFIVYSKFSTFCGLKTRGGEYFRVMLFSGIIYIIKFQRKWRKVTDYTFNSQIWYMYFTQIFVRIFFLSK